MSLETIRNVKTGEIREVETTSDEYAELLNEVYDHDGSARPKWENTSLHHARRLDSGEVQETDHGYEDKPVPGAELDVSEIGPDPRPWEQLTEAEVEAGIKDYDQKAKELGLQPNLSARHVEPLERTAPEDRSERAQDRVGRSKSGKRGRKGGSGSSSSGSSGSSGSGGSGQTTSASGSSGGSSS